MGRRSQPSPCRQLHGNSKKTRRSFSRPTIARNVPVEVLPIVGLAVSSKASGRLRLFHRSTDDGISRDFDWFGLQTASFSYKFLYRLRQGTATVGIGMCENCAGKLTIY